MDSSIQNALNWRYATKLFNVDKKVSDKDLGTLLESIRLAPSSHGLQPWKIIVVTDKETREKLKKASWNQSQVTDASHLIVFAARKNINDEYIDSFFKRVVEVSKKKAEDIKGHKQMILGSVKSRSPEAIEAWNARQVYIALGFLLETAAFLKIDTCPMEGFDPVQFDEILGLTKSDYTTVVLSPIGYRSDADKYALAPKIRFEKKDIVVMV